MPMPKKPFSFYAAVCLCLLTACGQNNTSTNQPTKDSAQADFVGCYSVEKNTPAQILIKADKGNFSMQMKEPDGSWDSPEALITLDHEKGWEFFKVNALNLNASDVLSVIGRDDEVLTLAQIKPAAAAINPQLDSEYTASLFGAVNTIYKVACDDVGMSLAPKDHLHPHPIHQDNNHKDNNQKDNK